MDYWQLLYVLLFLGLLDWQVRPTDRILERLGAALEPFPQGAELSGQVEAGIPHRVANPS